MARNYTPRRSGKQWREQCPDGVLDCFDNKGKTADRYTVFFAGDQGVFHVTDGHCIRPGGGDYHNTYVFAKHMSENPFSPQGVGMTDEFKAHEAVRFRYDRGHDRVRWLDLPEKVRECCEQFIRVDA